MPAAQTLVVFMAAALALNVTPGPSIAYVMSRSFGQGRRAGLVSALGLGTGSLLHALAATLGLSAMLAYSPAAYATVTYLGAGALFFLSFLPQFVDPARGSAAAQTLVFGLLFRLTGVPINMLVAVAGGAMAASFARSPLLERLRDWLAGTVLLGLGLRLALSERR